MKYEDLVAFIKQARETADDQTALKAKELYNEWEYEKTIVGDDGVKVKVPMVYAVGNRIRYDDKLYRCELAHTAEAHNTPDLIPALWVVINETNAGTIDDPIPAAKGMEYTKGLYYIEDGKIYLMSRQGMADGETITLQYLPSELVGQYFDLV